MRWDVIDLWVIQKESRTCEAHIERALPMTENRNGLCSVSTAHRLLCDQTTLAVYRGHRPAMRFKRELLHGTPSLLTFPYYRVLLLGQNPLTLQRLNLPSVIQWELLDVCQYCCLVCRQEDYQELQHDWPLSPSTIDCSVWWLLCTEPETPGVETLLALDCLKHFVLVPFISKL